MSKLAGDISYPFRQMRRAPGFTATAVLTLALGIGASSAIFCLIDGLWLHPLRIPHPGGLVQVIGQVVQLIGFNTGPSANIDARIVGVTEDAPINQIGEIPEPYIYVPFHLSQMGEITFALETKQNAMSLAQATRQILIHTNPLLDPMMVTSLPELIRYSAGNYQMMAELVSALGFIGLALTVVGLYGFLAFRVSQRFREIGIRMSLGASRESTALLILRDTARMAAIGLVLGLLLAIGATRLETSMLFGVRPLDALSLLGAIAVLSIAISLAAWLPARRAASVDPMQALRTE